MVLEIIRYEALGCVGRDHLEGQGGSHLIANVLFGSLVNSLTKRRSPLPWGTFVWRFGSLNATLGESG